MKNDDLCTDYEPYNKLKREDDSLERKIRNFKKGGDTQKQIEQTKEYHQLQNSTLNKLYPNMRDLILNPNNHKINNRHNPPTKQNPNKNPSKQNQNQNQNHRFTVAAIAQLIQSSNYALNLNTALLNAFKGTTKTLNLTKKEKKLAKLCFELGQADLQQRIIAELFVNERAAPNMKLLAEMSDLINDNTDQAKGTAASLNISLTSKAEKKVPNPKSDDKNQNRAQDAPGPLTLYTSTGTSTSAGTARTRH